MDSSILFMIDDVETLIQFNLTGPIELTRLLLPGMQQRKQGHITSLDKGNYKARSVKIFPFERIPDAHRLMEANSANRKIVVVR